ncbi:hypothetical protein C8R43DRAFT_1126609 [Mycena crocata]|nr:hypothetical protein C8R43DRAFT_1126609 [Mycena crocata]
MDCTTDSHQAPNFDSPPEAVLRRIYDYLRYLDENSRPELTLASMNSHWRQVSISTPLLWTRIRINHDRQISVLGEVLLRSKNLPLGICIHLDAFRYRFCTEYEAAIDLLLPHVERWRSLKIIASNPVLHNIRTRIHRLSLSALEHLELVQSDNGRIQHLGPFLFDPAIFRSLRLERTMIYAADAALLAGLTHIELVQSSLTILDEHKLLSVEYPTREPRPPSMTALTHLALDGSSPATNGLPYTPAFSTTHLTSVSLARLSAPSMDLVQALAHIFGAALAAPRLRELAVADMHGHALVMLLAVVRATRFPALRRLEVAGVETSGVDDGLMAAFAGGVAHLVLARVDAQPILSRLADPAIWPSLERIEIDGVDIARPQTRTVGFAAYPTDRLIQKINAFEGLFARLLSWVRCAKRLSTFNTAMTRLMKLPSPPLPASESRLPLPALFIPLIPCSNCGFVSTAEPLNPALPLLFPTNEHPSELQAEYIETFLTAAFNRLALMENRIATLASARNALVGGRAQLMCLASSHQALLAPAHHRKSLPRYLRA